MVKDHIVFQGPTGSFSHGDDTPLYFGRLDGSEVPVWFQLPFEKYKGYSMSEPVVEQIVKRVNCDYVYLVDFANGFLLRFQLSYLKHPDTVLLPKSCSEDDVEDMYGVDTGIMGPEIVKDLDLDGNNPQRLIPVSEITKVADIQRKGGESYRGAVFTDMGND